MHYEYHIQHQPNISVETSFIFDLTKITTLKIPPSSLNYYLSNPEIFVNPVDRKIDDLGVCIRYQLYLIIFDADNNPTLNKII